MKRVLIVDDELDIANVLADLLELEGYDVRTANDGDDALAQLEQELPDLVLTDYMMPKCDGGELVARMQGDRRLRQVPVIVMSAVTSELVRGMPSAAFLRKPFQVAALLTEIERVLAQRAS